MDGRAVEGSGLENRQGCKPLVGSNPTPSATSRAFRRAPERSKSIARLEKPVCARPTTRPEDEMQPPPRKDQPTNPYATRTGWGRPNQGAFYIGPLPKSPPPQGVTLPPPRP